MKKNTVATFFILILTIGIAFFALQPLIAYDSELEGTLQDVTDQKDKAELAFNHAKQVSADIGKLTEMEKQKMLRQIPESDDQESIIKSLSSIAQQFNMSLNGLTFSKTAIAENPRKMVIQTSLFSPATIPLLEILKAIEETDRLFTVKAISMTQGKMRSDLTLTLEAYYKK